MRCHGEKKMLLIEKLVSINGGHMLTPLYAMMMMIMMMIIQSTTMHKLVGSNATRIKHKNN